MLDDVIAETGFPEPPMTTNRKRWPRALTPVLGAMVLSLYPGEAQAQWGTGYGWGWGGFGFRNVPSPTNYLNQHALTRAAAGAPARPSHSPYANSSNAYFNRIRDNGFVSHYDVRRRQAPEYQPVPTAPRARAGAAEPQPAPLAAASDLIPPLASFFNEAQQLVWPNDSPTAGDLKEKRAVSDQAALAVLEETKRQVTATMSSVTHARQKLIAYGQPALQEVRSRATPAIADTFHRFLLSLYDSLGQAAGPADAGSGTAPHP
jgi:hypothetical protein